MLLLAFAKGGALETVIDGQTGIMFPRQDKVSLCSAIQRFFMADWDQQFIRKHAEKFSEKAFEEQVIKLVADLP